MKKFLLTASLLFACVVSWGQSFSTGYTAYLGTDQFNFLNYTPTESYPLRLNFSGKPVDLGMLDFSLGVGTNITRNVPAVSANISWQWQPALTRADSDGHRVYGYVGLRASAIWSQEAKFSVDSLAGRTGLEIGIKF